MPHPYFIDQARTALTALGSPDADPNELAQWAEDHRPTGDTMPLAAIVADDGTVIATTERVTLRPGLSASYVREIYIDLPDGAPFGIDREVEDMAASQLSRITGKRCATIRQSTVCTGAGKRPGR